MSVRLQLQMPLHPYGLYTDHHTAEKGTENTLKEDWSESTGLLQCCSSTCLHPQYYGFGLLPYEALVMTAGNFFVLSLEAHVAASRPVNRLNQLHLC